VQKDVRVVRLNADETASAAKALKIDALPTFIIYKNGVETWRKVGIAKMSELKKQSK
jgi:thioredoxin-like negative regulator of GroEL